MGVLQRIARRALGTIMVLGLLALAGCAMPRTTVVLLPDQDGHVGAVVVSGAGTSERVDRAYRGVVVVQGSAPSATASMDEKSLAATYGDLLKAEPSKPLVYVLKFLIDSTTMTESSKAKIPYIIEAVRLRQPTEVTVYGHTDATGTEAHNDRLSAERARVVAELLRRSDAHLAHIELRACGDRMPAVPSGAHAAEPRNRRAEVVIL